MIDLTGKVAIVTGAAGGQGGASAETMAKLGAAVVLADIRDEGAQENAEAIRAAGGRAIAVHADVRDEADVERMTAEAVDAFGRLDVLHSNAADVDFLFDPGDPVVTELKVENWRAQFETIVLGAALACKHAIPAMLAGDGGSIICTTSASSLVGELNLTVYGCAKSAVNQLVRAVSTQYGKQGIRCNGIAPGLVLSPPGLAVGDEMIGQYIDHSDLTYVAEPQDIANIVAFLASGLSRCISGSLVMADGGFTTQSPLVAGSRVTGRMAGA